MWWIMWKLVKEVDIDGTIIHNFFERKRAGSDFKAIDMFLE